MLNHHTKVKFYSSQTKTFAKDSAGSFLALAVDRTIWALLGLILNIYLLPQLFYIEDSGLLCKTIIYLAPEYLLHLANQVVRK